MLLAGRYPHVHRVGRTGETVPPRLAGIRAVGDLFDIVPQLTSEVSTRRG